MKHEIVNRHGLKIVIQTHGQDNKGGLVFIAHGQGGFKEQPHIQAFKNAFLHNNYFVVLFDATNSIGESDGDLLNVTQTNYLEDLEDVILWSSSQSWYSEPFALCGHSMGGMSTTLFAEKYPEKVSKLVPASPVVNYKYSIDGKDPDFIKAWKDKGYYESASSSKPGVIKRIGWGYVEDLKNHDLIKNAQRLEMPVLIVVGDMDQATPVPSQKVLFEAIKSSNKKLVVIKDSDHNFKGEDDYENKLSELSDVISNWLKEN